MAKVKCVVLSMHWGDGCLCRCTHNIGQSHIREVGVGWGDSFHEGTAQGICLIMLTNEIVWLGRWLQKGGHASAILLVLLLLLLKLLVVILSVQCICTCVIGATVDMRLGYC